jgi:adhesin HecA-like repeat protein
VEIFIELDKVSINRGNYANLLIFGLFLVGLVVIFSCGVSNVSAASPIYVSTHGNDSWNGLNSIRVSGTLNGPKATIKNATGTVKSGGTVKIASGIYKENKIIINKNMIITGAKQSNTIINGTNNGLIFHIIYGVKVTISNLTLTNGKNTNSGGAIGNEGTLTINNSTIKDSNSTNSYYGGGAIFNGQLAILTVNNSTFIDNIGYAGGAIFNWGILIVNSSKFMNNTAPNFPGGAICNVDDTMTIKNSTFTGNTASDGGAIYNNQATASVHFNRIVGNNAKMGNAIYNENGGKVNATFNWWGSNAGPSTAMIYGSMTVKPWLTIPTVTSTTPNNLKTGVSRTSPIYIKFSENIKASTYFNNITIKNLTTGKTVSISKSISGTTLNIKTTSTRTANTWYQVTIPAKAIKDNAGNNLLATYTFKFKTGT